MCELRSRLRRRPRRQKRGACRACDGAMVAAECRSFAAREVARAQVRKCAEALALGRFGRLGARPCAGFVTDDVAYPATPRAAGYVRIRMERVLHDIRSLSPFLVGESLPQRRVGLGTVWGRRAAPRAELRRLDLRDGRRLARGLAQDASIKARVPEVGEEAAPVSPRPALPCARSAQAPHRSRAASS